MMSNQDSRMHYYNLMEEDITRIFNARSNDEIQTNMDSLVRDLKGLVRVVEDNIRLNELRLRARKIELEKRRGVQL